jgi:hypothetical protein
MCLITRQKDRPQTCQHINNAKDLQINCRSFYDGNFMPEEGGQLVKGGQVNFYNTFNKASYNFVGLIGLAI